MAPINSRLSTRSGPTSSNFTVIFCTISSVIILCLVGGFAVPKIRRWWQVRPITTSSARDSDSSPSVITFPCHPAMCRGLGQTSSTQPRWYGPKHKTPFPNTPTRGNSSIIPSKSLHHRPHSLDSGGDDVFTPDRRSTEALRASSSNLPGSDAEYTLPLPEPCLLMARSCGRAPSLGLKLDKFPVPQSFTTNILSDKLLHPNKLFNELDGRHSISFMGTPTRIPARNESEKTCISLTASEQEDPGSVQPRMEDSSRDKPPALNLPEEYLMKHWRLRRLHQRGTWSSTANSSHLKAVIHGAGMKPGCSQAASRLQVGSGMMATAPSEMKCSNSTRPQEATRCNYNSFDAALTFSVEHSLPNLSPTTRAPIPNFEDATSGAMILQSGPMCSIPEDKMAGDKKGIVVAHAGPPERCRASQLKLSNIRKSPSLSRRVLRNAPSVRSLLIPLVMARRPSLQASSVYSRDTLGASISRSPISPTFSANVSISTIQDKVTRTRKAASSAAFLTTKIDNWCLDTGKIQAFSTSPLAGCKRPFSDFGPYSPTFPDSGFGSVYRMDNDGAEAMEDSSQTELPTICIGRPSDDIFRDPIPTINESIHELKAKTTMRIVPVPSKGSAPGGADWV